jgi:hypothetical protein
MAEQEEVKIETNERVSPIEELRQRIDELELAIGVVNPRNMAGLRNKDLIQATAQNWFGDGSDGDVVITGNTTLTRDMYYRNLTIENGGVLNAASFRIRVKETCSIKNGGKIHNNGGDGGDGGAPTAGAAGAQVPAGSLPRGSAGKPGGAGAGGSGVPGDGQDGDSVSKSIGSAGVGGGGGGRGYANAGAGGNGGSQIGTAYNLPLDPISATLLFDTQPSPAALTGSAGSGSGGGGGSGPSSSAYSGGGGGSGASGGFVWLAARRLMLDGAIEAKGGKGGNGGDASGTYNPNIDQSFKGGGGGGAGGPGGVVVLIYGQKTGTGTIDVSGGAGGAGGQPLGGNAGSPGANGPDGKVWEVQVLSS